MNATEFLQIWVNKRVDVLQCRDGTSQVSDEVSQCLDAAFKIGVSECDLDAAASGNITVYLLRARNSPDSNILETEECGG